MNSFHRARSFALVLPLLAGLAACVSGTKQSAGLRQVDDLLGRIERVQAETLLARQKSAAALAALRTLVDPDFAGDPRAGFAAFAQAIDESERQAKALRGGVLPMKSAAETLFARWNRDLDAFQNVQMRERSQTRLEETRRRYDAIVATADPVLWSYDAYNATLRDHALFLGHDLNAAAVDALADGIDELEEQLEDLDERFGACERSAIEYVRSSALVGRIEVVDEGVPARTPAASK